MKAKKLNLETIREINTASKRVNNEFKTAKSDLKNVSPFFFINQLNKLAKANEYCEHINIKECSDTISGIFGTKGFSADVLHKEPLFGNFANLVKIPSNVETATITRIVSEENEGIIEVTTTNKNTNKTTTKEYARYNETLMFAPITPSLVGYINAFQKRVKESLDGMKASIRSNK